MAYFDAGFLLLASVAVVTQKCRMFISVEEHLPFICILVNSFQVISFNFKLFSVCKFYHRVGVMCLVFNNRSVCHFQKCHEIVGRQTAW